LCMSIPTHCMRLSPWQREPERRAVRGRLENREIAAVVEHDLARDGEAEAHAFADFARGDVGIEDARADRVGDAGTVGGDVEECRRANAMGRKLDLPVPGYRARAVRAEIHENLAQHVPVDVDLNVRSA